MKEKKSSKRLRLGAYIISVTFFFVLSTILIAYSLWYLFNYKSLTTSGKSITTYTSIQPKGKCTSGETNYDVSFSYTVDGQSYGDTVGTSCLSSFAQDQPQTIPIRYLPSSPDVYKIDEPFASKYLDFYHPNFAMLGPLYFGVFFLMIVVVGIYGLVPGKKPWWMLVIPEKDRMRDYSWKDVLSGRVNRYYLTYRFDLTRKQVIAFFLVVLPLTFVIPGLITLSLGWLSGAFAL